MLDEDGRIERANASLAAIVGEPAPDLTGRLFTDLAATSDTSVADHLGRLTDDSTGSGISDGVLRNLQGDDVYVSPSSRRLSHDDDPDSILLHVVDVSERRRYENRLSHLVDHDVLTGLAGYAGFPRHRV